MIRSRENERAQPAAGSRKRDPASADDRAQDRCRTTGNAVLGEHDGRVLARSGGRPVTRLPSALAFSVEMTISCGPSAAAVVGRLHARREFGAINAKRQAFCLHRCEMRPAHHAGHVMS